MNTFEKKLARDNEVASPEHSKVGKCFHSYRNGSLLRRGVVVKQTATNYRVWLADTFSGVLSESRTIPIARTAGWLWFDTPEESNAAYKKHFDEVEVA